MSRIGRLPIDIPKNVKVEVKDRVVNIEGPKGKISFKLVHNIDVKIQDSKIVVSCLADDKFSKSNFGTTRAILNNMIKGVVDGFKIELEIVGVGYKAQLKGGSLVIQVGFSHPVEIDIPKDLKVTIPKPNQIIVEGIDKVKVGEFASKLRRISPPEPYKGKGIRYVGEIVRKKLGKALAK
ncbi:MAG: 50S ribosomal protein L6 [Candidatus Omnitrophica bacterium]|nr:50S ribosomal protein L6 [Candidatus Omnitrophota bacterium]MCM8826868.1 50S ribosomal protein L6 [Candidatus Omnitrophota bacterium]